MLSRRDAQSKGADVLFDPVRVFVTLTSHLLTKCANVLMTAPAIMETNAPWKGNVNANVYESSMEG
jgi:hypothetical protein